MNKIGSEAFSTRYLIVLCAICLMVLSGKVLLANNLQQFTPIAEIKIPFAVNCGQFNDEVLFHASVYQGSVFITQDKRILYNLSSHGRDGRVLFSEKFKNNSLNRIIGADAVQSEISYFKGRDSNRWKRNVPAFERLDFGYIDAGIRLHLKAGSKNIEKIFVVEPGADPDRICVYLENINDLDISNRGELIINTGSAAISFTRPIAFQEINGVRQFVDITYIISDSHYGFHVGNYNKNYELIIDPLLSSTYIGGSETEGGDEFWWIWSDQGPDGSVYVAGMTLSPDFPADIGAYEDEFQGNHDLFISKFSADLSTLQACTYLGGSDFDQIWSFVADGTGDVYISGITYSTNFPTTPGVYDDLNAGNGDVFISRLNSDLTTLLASTLIGGIGSEFRPGIAIDGNGDVFVAGMTDHGSFPWTSGVLDEDHNGGWDFFVSKFNNGLTSLLASTFLGGSYREDYPSILLDNSGNVFVSGTTGSDNYPWTAGAYDTDLNGDPGNDWSNLDVCVSKLSNDLSTIIASTFYGAEDYESGLLSCMDEASNIYVCGHTWDANFPVTGGVLDEEFSGDEYHVTKFDNSLATRYAATFTTPNNSGLGHVWDMKSDNNGYIYLVGSTISVDFPITGNSYDRYFNGGRDGFLMKIDNDLTAISHSTFLGSSGDEGISSITIDDSGDAYLAGYTNAATDFPILPGAYDNDYNGGNSDAFVAKLTFNQFTRITEGPHVSDGGHSWSVNWIDYNNDGQLDLFVSNLDIDNGLYQNNGDETFTKITGEVLTVNSGGIGSAGATWGDYNNDGYPDVFIATFREGSPPVNKAFTNNGDGSFSQITGSAIVGIISMSIDPSWVDYNNDGLLDLYVANHEGPNYLYRQDDTGFARIITGQIATDNSHSNSACWADYNNDGNQDLYVANGWSNPNDCLYENNGDGSFNKILSGSPTANSGVSWGGSWGDYDNDGFMDLFVTQSVWNSPGISYDSLYRNNGDGTFTSPSGISPNMNGSYSSGSSWGDFDNDGDLDLFVAVDGPNLLYENLGEGSFTHLTEGDIVTDNKSSTGCAFGDYDRDGDLDLFVTNVQQDNDLYRNNGNANNWINIKCEGTRSNRSAIGTKVRIRAVIDGSSVWQMREISSKTGKNGQNSMNAHFGLGDAAIIDSIVAEWPSGMVDTLTSIEVNQFMTITETLCGDANGDRAVNIGDVVYITNHVFRNAECATNPPIGCPPDPYKAGDVNCDISVNIGDAVFLGNVIFRPGSPGPCATCF